MTTNSNLHSESYPVSTDENKISIGIRNDCAWILTKATFLNEDSISEAEALLKRNLIDCLEE
jgi:hypothetical protein